ncbi:MAG: DUF1360 domain-containing protein [Actinomycetota bacterium]|nr:DUF1360 domain-containing protein [Actinomycetota bacterium]
MDPLPQTPTGPQHYAALNLTWSGLMAGLLAATKLTGRDAPAGAELPVLGLATFALAKALSKEKVGSWLREAVVEESPDGEKQPKGSGLRYAAGELVSCSRCLGTWSSLGLVGLRVARPREGRIVASVLATAALNDVLQCSFSLLNSKANASAAGAEVVSAEARDAQVRLARLEAVHGDGDSA